MLMNIVLCLIIGYFFGCLQTGYFYGKLHGIDIRDYGSGNAGTTNILRTLGKKAGYITYAGDALKGVIAIVFVRLVIFGHIVDPVLPYHLLAAYTGLGVAVGHNHPFYLKFKGGKGIAVTSGVMFAIDWRFALIACATFLILFYATRYVSVGSLGMSLTFPICCVIFYPGEWHLFAVAVVFWIMAWVRHRANIKRLLTGTENRFPRKGEKKEAD